MESRNMNVPLVIADQCDTIVAAQSVKSARPRPPPLTEQELKALSHADLFRIGMERAQHRAQTQEGLVKYKNANRVHVVGQPVGYGIIRKSKGLDDVVHIKRLDEYQREQLAKVAKIMSETVPNFRDDERFGHELDIQESFNELIRQVERIDWLEGNDRRKFVEVFAMDFGVRFHEIVATIRTSGFPTRKVRALIPRVFDMIGNANSGIMEKCCARKIEMDKNNVFDKETNLLRLLSFFRSELAQKLDTNKIVQRCIRELNDGVSEASQDNALKMGLRKFKDALNNASTLKKLDSSAVYDPRTILARDKNFVNNYLKKPTNTAPALSARQALELEREVQIFNDLAGLLAEKRAPIIRGLDQDCIDDVVVDAEEMALADSNEDEAALKRVKTKIEGEESLLRMRVPLYKSESKVAPVNIHTVINKRYLTASTDRKPYLLDWQDFEQLIVDDSPASRDLLQDPITEQHQPLAPRFSTRIPKGFIESEMTAVYGENAAGTLSLAELEVLDAKLVRAKEVDDFYVEFLEGAMDKHIEFLDDTLLSKTIPAAPNDMLASMSYAYQGLVNLDELEMEDGNNDEQSQDVYSSQASTTKPMSVISSSSGSSSAARKFGILNEAFEENQSIFTGKNVKSQESATGNMIKRKMKDLKLKGRPDPTKTTQTRPTNEFRRTPFSFEEYKKFVRPRATDFLHNLVLPFDDRAYRSRLETDSNASARLLAMSTNFSVDSLALSNVASNAEKFKKGLFSFDLSAISDVLEEEEEEEEGNRMGKKNGVMQKQSVPSIVEPQEESAEVAQPTNISAAIQNRQDRLDAIWKKLQMPMEQRLAMLTKYSVGTYAKKLKNSLSLWEDAAYLIGHREALLPQLLELEINQCDPDRYRNDSKSREAENDKRASMLARLKKQTDRLQRVLNSIKSHFDDVVCYQGTPYAEKMIHDYSNIQYRAVEEYKRRVRLPPINNVQKQ